MISVKKFIYANKLSEIKIIEVKRNMRLNVLNVFIKIMAATLYDY